MNFAKNLLLKLSVFYKKKYYTSNILSVLNFLNKKVSGVQGGDPKVRNHS
jgi:hypothetical protein